MKKTIDRTSDEIMTLESLDPKLKKLFDHVGDCPVELNHPYFPFFVYTIIGQQVSLKVADMLYERLKAVFEINPENILSKPHEFYRELGLSYRKAEYLHHVALFFLSDDYKFLNLESLTKDEVYEIFIKIKGVGPWSIDMFIMFCLSDMDHFSKKDIGLINAYNACFNVVKTPDEIEKDALNWRPYRSIVAHYLWHYNDN